jgi:hypothetical protein
MAEAYVDESGHQAQPGYYGVAGFIGSAYQWGRFTTKWTKTLSEAGVPYLHMREFAHSVDGFRGWSGDPRREQLMAGVVQAITHGRLTAVGSALRTADFNALAEGERTRLGGSPYYGCLQDVLYGFALTAQNMPAGEILTIIVDHNDYEHRAQQMYQLLRQRGAPYDRLAPALQFADMRQTPGIQAADVLAYEVVKELSNQDRRPDDKMRWPLDQILTDQASREIAMIVYRNRGYLQGQVDQVMDTAAGVSIVDEGIDEMLRIYRQRRRGGSDGENR